MILLVVFDGLRPDQITEEHTPNLCRLAQRGVRFLNHHATFPTHTRVNVASLMTGCYPGRHGLVGNAFYLSGQEPPWKVDTGDYRNIARLDDETGGHALLVETLGEVLAQAGQRMVSVGVGSTGNAFLHNRKADKVGGVVIHPQITLPSQEANEIERSFGAWPAAGVPNAARMQHATTILLERVIPTHQPALASLWLSEPDNSQHRTSVASPEAMEGIRRADVQLGRVLEYLEVTGLSGSTDLLVASDHGHSTVTRIVTVAEELVKSGLKEGPDSTDVVVADNGGCVLINARDHNQARVRSMAEFLMAQPWCGSLFVSSSLSSIPGSFPLDLILNQSPRSPDILISFAWDTSQNPNRVEGGASGTPGIGVGRGSHGSISPYEINNILVADGPHFRQGLQDPIPSGNVDLFPTILHILGLTSPDMRDGRVLSEALVGGPEPGDVFVEKQVHRASARVGTLEFRQELQMSKVGQTLYLDTGTVFRA